MSNKLEQIINEIEKVIIGKREMVEQVMMAILANGHILLDDVPGVGKTTLALTISKVLNLDYHRVQFTPDVMPSDIVGFSIYDKNTGSFKYMPGVVTNTNLLLADEINRTTSKTQSALLEAMEEGQITVDAKAHKLKTPFIVIATQNQVGAAGTQLLPHAQLDRFLVQLTIGYPDYESQKEIIKGRQSINPYEALNCIASCDEILKMQKEVLDITMNDEIVSYIADLAVASRSHSLIDLGISPRGAIAVSHMAKAAAYICGRNYVIPDDICKIFCNVCAHRILISREARAKHMTAADVIEQLMSEVKIPSAIK